MRTPTVERILILIAAAAVIILYGLQVSSLFVTPIHDSYLWWGDESWLMSEYRSQITTGVFRHPTAYGSSLWIGNPFPFTAMWATSALYGFGSMLLGSLGSVDAGRVITALVAALLLLALWKTGRYMKLSPLAILSAIALLISTRSFFLTGHSARYDIISSLALLLLLSLLARWEVGCPKRYLLLGLIVGLSLLVSAHVLLLLLPPVVFFVYVQRAKLTSILMLVVGALGSVGVLYLVHVALQPALAGETNISENLRTIPILRPFSWSVQSNNLVQKWELVISFAPQILLMILACIEGLRCPDLSRRSKNTIILFMLPMLGWVLFEPAGPSSYLIHFLPGLALAAAVGINSILVGSWQRAVVGVVALGAVGFGLNDAITAGQVSRELTAQHAVAIAEARSLIGDKPVIALNPAQSSLESARLGTTHFVELPHSSAMQLAGNGYLLSYNSSIAPGFMWEVMPLRQKITSPELVLTGQFLDVGRSYFHPLDDRLDTLFLQRVDLSALYRRHNR